MADQLRLCTDDQMKPKRKQTVVTIDNETHRAIKAHCDRHGMKVGHLASEAVRIYLIQIKASTLGVQQKSK